MKKKTLGKIASILLSGSLLATGISGFFAAGVYAATTDWPSFQGNTENNGTFEAADALRESTVKQNSVSIGSDGARIDSEPVVCQRNGNNYVYTLYGDSFGADVRAYNANDPAAPTQIWEAALSSTNIPFSQLSTPAIVGDSLYVACTRYTMFDNGRKTLAVSAGGTGSTDIGPVTLDADFRTIQISTGLTSTTAKDYNTTVTFTGTGGTSGTYTYTRDSYGGGNSFIIYDEDGKNTPVRIPKGTYNVNVSLTNNTSSACTATLSVCYPEWRFLRIDDITAASTSSKIPTTLKNGYGQAAAPVKAYDGSLYFSIYDGDGSYYKYTIDGGSWTKCTPAAIGTSPEYLYNDGAIKVTISGTDYIVFGGDSGKLYLARDGSDFTEAGGTPSYSRDLGTTDSGGIRSSIARFGDYLFFTSRNGYVWRTQFGNLIARPSFIYAKLTSNNSVSTPTIGYNGRIYVGYYNYDTHIGGVDFVQWDSSAQALVKKNVIQTKEVTCSPIVYTTSNLDYIYFTENTGSGNAYCYSYNGTTTRNIWTRSGAAYALQGMAAGSDFLVYGDDDGQVHFIN
jgi:hypothetical protein